MKNFKELVFSTGVLFLALNITACSDESQNQSNNGADTANLADAVSEKGQEQAAASAMPKGDPKMPLEQYKVLTSDIDIMFTYYALSSIPLDYDKILSSYSNEYRGASDEFRKQDILNALKPKIDQEIQNAKNPRYLKMTWNGFRLNKYDFQAKGFSQDGLSLNSSLGWENYGYRLAFTNGDNFKFLKVEDEAQARVIEERRSKYEQLDLVLYVYAQDADLNDKKVKTQILHLQLLDAKGNELFFQ